MVMTVKNDGYLTESINLQMHRNIITRHKSKSQYYRSLVRSTEDKYVEICQYADDTILLLGDEQELKTAISLMTRFGELSGMK